MPAVLLLSVVTAQRLAELWLARRNTAALVARGAIEIAPGHYPLIVLLHALWLSGLWILGWARPVSMAWLTVYLALQALRAWTLLTLGPRWTTRIIVLPGAPLAEEEPENPDYPQDPAFKERFGPRGVIKSIANPDGTQTIEDTGPLTTERMETVDVEVTDGALDFIDRAHAANKPFFLWWNSTRMHIWTHLKPESQGVTGIGLYPDGMVEHDGMVGQLLDKLDELGIADNTIVMYSTDNGAEMMTWPDGGTTPFRGEKNTNWEGGYRVPTAIRWPGVIEPGTVYNDVFAHEDMLPTLLAAAGEPGIKEELLTGHSAIGRDYKVHLDGYNLLPYFKGEAEAPRQEFLYWTDDGDLAALRYGQWKIQFMEQRAHGFDVWQEPFVPLRTPKLFTLRGDPFERADHEGIGYATWRIERMFALVPAQAYVAQWLTSFKDFPPRQKPASFGIDQVMDQLTSGVAGAN